MAYHSLQIWIGRDFRAILAKHVSQISYWEGLVWKEGNFDFMRRSFDETTQNNRKKPRVWEDIY